VKVGNSILVHPIGTDGVVIFDESTGGEVFVQASDVVQLLQTFQQLMESFSEHQGDVVAIVNRWEFQDNQTHALPREQSHHYSTEDSQEGPNIRYRNGGDGVKVHNVESQYEMSKHVDKQREDLDMEIRATEARLSTLKARWEGR